MGAESYPEPIQREVPVEELAARGLHAVSEESGVAPNEEDLLDNPEALSLSEDAGQTSKEDGPVEIQLYESEKGTDALQLFLDETKRHKLLTAAQEVKLAKTMEAGASAKQRLEKLDAVLPGDLEMPLSDRDELIRIIKEGEVAKEKMVNCNLRLVVSIAKKSRGHGVPFLDLIQEGVLGLDRAAEKFDWQRGYKFSTYATWWITQAVQRALHNSSRTIRVPVHVSERKSKISRAEKRLWQELGRDPTREELAEDTGLPLQQVMEALDAAHVHTSLDKPIGEEDESDLMDMFSDRETPDPFEQTEESLRKQSVREALDSLPTREKRIIELRFGFEGEPMTLEQIGRELDLTRERVRQLEGQALRKLASNPVARSLAEDPDNIGDFTNGSLGSHRNVFGKEGLSRAAAALQLAFPELSSSEAATLELESQGLSRFEIARKLGLSEITIKNNFYQIKAKLDASDNLEAIEKAVPILKFFSTDPQ